MKALEGPAGLLFLVNDKNDTAGQLAGTRIIPPDTLEAWQRYIEETKATAARHNAHSAFMIAPAKEDVFRDLYPFPRADITPIEQLLSLPQAQDFLWPRDLLQSERHLTYPLGDTHWTAYGARVAASAYLSAIGLGQHIEALPNTFSIDHRVGDLGEKVDPVRSEPWLLPSIKGRMIYCNRIKNHGRIDVYTNKKPVVAETFVLFGDSFGISVAKVLSNVFERVVFCHTAGYFDEYIVGIERPAYVLMEIAQRFIVEIPSDRNPWTSAAEKVAIAEPEVLERIKSANTDADDSCQLYAERMLKFIGTRKEEITVS